MFSSLLKQMKTWIVLILSCRCAPGFYGNPMVVGSTCQPCHCNSNTDPNMLFTDCHPLTGECLSCMHNTTGHRCDVCAPGYYGDAIGAKNCTSESGFRLSSLHHIQLHQCQISSKSFIHSLLLPQKQQITRLVIFVYITLLFIVCGFVCICTKNAAVLRVEQNPVTLILESVAVNLESLDGAVNTVR